MKYNILKIAPLVFTIIAPISVFADEYVTLSKTFPVKIDPTIGGFGMYALLNALLTISVGVAAILAVIILTIGGFRYMTTDSVFNISGAKDQIINAIVGLLIVLVAVLMLKVINPDIVQLKLFM